MAPKSTQAKNSHKPPSATHQPEPGNASSEAPNAQIPHLQTPRRSLRVAAAKDVTQAKAEDVSHEKTTQLRGFLHAQSPPETKLAVTVRGKDPKQRTGDRDTPENVPSECNAI